MTDPAPTTVAAPRKLRFHVLRHDPRDPDSVPHVELFELEEAAGMTLFIALNEIREQLDSSLAFDFVCRAGICGSCQTRVCAGVPDHRDLILSDADKAAGQSLMICVSRALGDSLVLDL